MESLIGQVVDNYRILSIIGKGGMGVVFKAIDISIDKVVALKMIDPFLAQDSEFFRRFKTEARALAKLKNPHIVTVHTLRETEKGTFIVMEYVNPKNLSDCIKEKGFFSLEDTVAICRQLLDGIAHAHNAGIIHRDIKPSNILISDTGEVKITDFGLAKVIKDQGPDSTVAQVKAGTLNYMSPEQIKGLIHVDKRSDIYSIGITLYEMLAGRVPFEKTDSDFDIQKMIVDGKIPSPVRFNSSIPKSMEKFVLKAAQRDPSKRYQSVEEMLAELDKIEVISKANVPTSGSKKVNHSTSKKKKFQISQLFMLIAAFSALGLIIFIIVKNINFTPNDSSPDQVINNSNDTTKIDTIESFATLDITSYPVGAKLYLNGKKIGESSLIFDSLKMGYYTIKIVKENYIDFNLNFAINNLDTTIFINEILAPISKVINTKKVNTKVIDKKIINSKLTLQIKPAGNIYLNDKLIATNTSDKIIESLIPGKHKIKFEHPDYGEKIVNISLKEAERTNYTCYFQQDLNIQTLNESGEAIWASIFLNDNSTDFYTPKVIALGPGTYKVYVSKTGFETIEEPKTITIEPSFSEEDIPMVFHLKAL